MKQPTCDVIKRKSRRARKRAATAKAHHLLKLSPFLVTRVCSNSGVCLALGNSAVAIKKLFQGFVGFEDVKSDLKVLGNNSVNGVALEVKYEKMFSGKRYVAYAVLKSARKAISDNLMYEYTVGSKFVNRFCAFFPCFVETYGLYYYKNSAAWHIATTKKEVPKTVLKQLELEKGFDVAKACANSTYAAVLVQHMEDAQTLFHWVREAEFVEKSLVYVLYVVYHALASLAPVFTHYDLHKNNVLLYEPMPGKQIRYEYHHPDGSVDTFSMPFLPKIIDYGRCYFDNNNTNSRTIYDRVCRECENCGKKVGFNYLDPARVKDTLVSSKKNESYDLILLKLVLKNAENLRSHGGRLLKANVLDHLVCNGFETVENLSEEGSEILNVKKAFAELRGVVNDPVVKAENEADFGNLFGVVRIYPDKPMQFVQNTALKRGSPEPVAVVEVPPVGTAETVVGTAATVVDDPEVSP
jgi:hypothetical protein